MCQRSEKSSIMRTKLLRANVYRRTAEQLIDQALELENEASRIADDVENYVKVIAILTSLAPIIQRHGNGSCLEDAQEVAAAAERITQLSTQLASHAMSCVERAKEFRALREATAKESERLMSQTSPFCASEPLSPLPL